MERLRRPPEVAHIRLPEAILTTRDCPKQVMLRVMAQEAQMLTTEEFASLLTVGNAPVNSSAPAIPAAHSARLIALGYMVDLLHGGPRGAAAHDHAGTNPDMRWPPRNWLMRPCVMSGLQSGTR